MDYNGLKISRAIFEAISKEINPLPLDQKMALVGKLEGPFSELSDDQKEMFLRVGGAGLQTASKLVQR